MRCVTGCLERLAVRLSGENSTTFTVHPPGTGPIYPVPHHKFRHRWIDVSPSAVADWRNRLDAQGSRSTRRRTSTPQRLARPPLGGSTTGTITSGRGPVTCSNGPRTPIVDSRNGSALALQAGPSRIGCATSSCSTPLTCSRSLRYDERYPGCATTRSALSSVGSRVRGASPATARGGAHPGVGHSGDCEGSSRLGHLGPEVGDTSGTKADRASFLARTCSGR
jgi:hypothetical protein